MVLLAIFHFLNSIEIRNFACSCPVHIRVVPGLTHHFDLRKACLNTKSKLLDLFSLQELQAKSAMGFPNDPNFQMCEG